MATFVREARALFDAAPHRRPIHLYCWRGGTWSGSLSWLSAPRDCLSFFWKGVQGLQANAAEFMGWDWPLIRVGATPGRPRRRLEELKRAGEQSWTSKASCATLDRPSATSGGMPSLPLNTSETCWPRLDRTDANRCIWVENESRRIGKVHLPEPFYQRMIACPALEMKRVWRTVWPTSWACTGPLRWTCFGRVRSHQKRGGRSGDPRRLEALDRGDLASAARARWRTTTVRMSTASRSGLWTRVSSGCAGVPLEEAARRLIADADARF